MKVRVPNGRSIALSKRNTTHGMSKNPAYSNWKDMEKRCFNPKNKRYKDYAERGISVHRDFVESFPTFLKEIGEKPEGSGWSVGRIDNNAWYTYGNIRWERIEQQARNHSKQRNNTSGITGVQIRRREISGRIYTTISANWSDPENGKRTKDFSVDKYGYEVAMQMAIAFREMKIKELNSNGIVYEPSHGSNK